LAQEVVADLDNQHNNITPDGGSAMEYAQYVLDVMVQVVVADARCCRTFNGWSSYIPQSSEDQRLVQCLFMLILQ
jgi:hypothetical protein